MNLKYYPVWNRALVLALLALAGPCALHAQRAARAIASLGAHGVVTSIVVTDGGQGYTLPPGIVLGGGGGAGASAVAVVRDGAVSGIQVLSGGAGYGKPPAVGIDPPAMAISMLGIGRGAQVTLMGELGSTQELQRVEAFDGSRNWTSMGSVVLTNSTWSFNDTNASVGGQRYYRAVAKGPERPVAPRNMVWLPPGVFRMGSPLSDPDYIASEGPQTEVRLTQGFFLGRKEVTQGEYWSLMGTNPATFTGDTNRPVETVSWAEAAAYCARLTQQEQAAGRIPPTWRYRLPTEAEWEYAARAGSPDRFSFAEAEADEYSWQADNCQGLTHPVGLLRPNAWGIYDLAGNVAEWGMDIYGDYPGARVLDPMGATAGLFRVVRGGSGAAPLAFCRAGARDARNGVDYRDAWLGFRVALAYARPEPEVQQTAVGGTISGTVLFKDSRLPVAGVAVYLYDTNFPVDTNNLQNNRPGFKAATLTGQDGRYCFSNVKPGGYGVAPMKSEDGLGWPIAVEGQSGSPLLVSSQDQQTVDFSVEDPSLLEWENLQYTVEIFVQTNGLANDRKLKVARRSFWLFGYFTYWQPVPEQQCEWDAKHVVHGLARIRMTSTYGYNLLFYGLENVYTFTLTLPSAPGLGDTALVEFPIAGCPEFSVFFWDLAKSSCQRFPSLVAPLAKPAQQVEFPGRFNASWQTVANAEGYVVELSADGTFTENDGQPTTSFDAGATNQCAVQWAATNASAQRPYYYRVIAYNSHVFSSPSQVVRIGYDAVAAPAVQPATQVTWAGFTANWLRLAGAQGYRLDVSTNADFSAFFLENQDVGNATRFSVTNLPSGGGRFFFRVRAVAGNVVSPDSAVSSAVLPGLAWIPSGTFVMGSPDAEPERFSNEGPLTSVTLTRGFWMSKFEVTQREYLAVLGANPSYCSGDLDRPVESVSWSEAKDYCAGLTVQERQAGRLPAGYLYRLPTEAEWEYACRAGTTNRFSHGDDSDYSGLAQYAWYDHLGGNTTHPVGGKRPNAWGLYDMHGNVGEWCLDWDGAYRGGSVTDPAPSFGSGTVARGGGWPYPGRSCRSAFRDGFYPGFKSNYLGFRPVLAPE